MYVPSQWEIALHCNTVSHWLGAYTEWFLHQGVVSAQSCNFISAKISIINMRPSCDHLIFIIPIPRKEGLYLETDLWRQSGKKQTKSGPQFSWKHQADLMPETTTGGINSSPPSGTCVSELDSIGSDNGLLPVWHQAITWTNADLLSIGPLGTKFSELWFKIHDFSFMKMHLKCRLRKGGHLVEGEMS